MDISDIVLSPDASDQIRLGRPINQDFIGLYQSAYADGADMPAVLVYKQGKTYEILDGIHRVTAAVAAGRQKTDAYVVQVKDRDVVEGIRRVVNMKIGNGLGAKERIEQALCLKMIGWPTEKAARAFGLSPSTLTLRQRADNARDRIVRLTDIRADVVQQLVQPSVLGAFAHVKRDDLLKELVSIAQRVKPRLPSATFELLAAEARSVATDQGAATLIAKWHKDYAPPMKRRGDGPLPTERAVIYRARVQLQRCVTYVDNTLIKSRLAVAERRQAVALLLETGKRLIDRGRQLESSQRPN